MDEGRVVGLGHVGVRLCERGDGAVERGALAEVRRDGDAVARAGMRAGERPATHPAVAAQRGYVDRLDVDRALPIPQLADVEVADVAVERRSIADPTEKDVARGLHQSLAFHDPLARV